MPRQRTNYRRITYEFPEDFPQRLERFKEESGLSWAEIARRLGTYPYTVRRWWKKRDASQHAAHDGAADVGGLTGSRPPVH